MFCISQLLYFRIKFVFNLFYFYKARDRIQFLMNKILSASFLVLTSFLLSACVTLTEAPSPESPVEQSQDSYTGLSVQGAMEKAKSKGVSFRVVQQDGEFFAVTMDFRPGRINAVVDNGVVVSFEVEGNGIESFE